MILVHPQHGNHDACYSDEVERMRKEGWVPAHELQRKEEEITPLKDEPPKPKTRRRKNDNGS